MHQNVVVIELLLLLLLQVRSKIMYNNSNPEWNQELRLGLQVRPVVRRGGGGADFSYPGRHANFVLSSMLHFGVCVARSRSIMSSAVFLFVKEN